MARWWSLGALLALLGWFALEPVFAVDAIGTAAPVEPAGTLVVADLREDVLWVVDVSRPEAARALPLPAAPHELLPLPDGRIVVSMERGGALALIDPSLREVTVLAVGGLPHGLGWDGRHVLLTDREAGAVRRFDPAGWPAALGEREPLPAPGWPHAIAVLPGGGYAAPLALRDVLRLWPPGSDASLDGGAAAVPPRDVTTATLPETLDVATVGGMTRIATAGAFGGEVQLFDADGDPVAVWSLGGRPVRVQFAPGGEVLAVALSAAQRVMLLDPARPEAPPRPVPVSGVPDGLAFSPDGALLAAGDVAGGGVRLIAVPGGEVVADWPLGTATGAMLWLRGDF